MSKFPLTGFKLKMLREKTGLTQAEVAKQVGSLHSQFVSNWERGLCMPPKHCLSNLAKLYKLTSTDRIELKERIFLDVSQLIAKQFKGLV